MGTLDPREEENMFITHRPDMSVDFEIFLRGWRCD
jgi:hypothetical protein